MALCPAGVDNGWMNKPNQQRSGTKSWIIWCTW